MRGHRFSERAGRVALWWLPRCQTGHETGQ
nr:MAG TPA: hypothetical protein [Caudoviricetes sp.]